MKLSDNGFALVWGILIITLFSLIGAGLYVYSTSRNNETETITKLPITNYNLGDYASIDYPCVPKPNEVLETKEQKYIQYSCKLDGNYNDNIGAYTINLYKYSSLKAMERLTVTCGFQNKGIQKISGHALEICHMPVHDNDPTETIIATLIDSDKNVRLQFFLTDRTYEAAYTRLTNFSSSLKIK